MGNTLRRSNSSPAADPTSRKPNFPSSTSRSLKLAPQVQDDDDSGIECPICFINFKELNDVVCCKGAICTDCYLSVAAAHPTNKLTCPFCNIDSFTVKYTPASTKDSSSEISSPPKPALEKRVDIFLHKSTVSDRLELEAEIRTQRSNSIGDVNPNPFNTSRSQPSTGRISLERSSSGVTRMGEFSSQQRVSRSAAAALARAGNVAQSRSPHVSPRPILTPAAVSDAEDLDFSTLSRLHSLLSGSNSQNMDDLEEIMMLEAIRQSLILDEASRAAEVAAASATAGAASSTSGATTSSSVQREETVVSNKVPPAIDTSSGDDTLENVDSLLPVAPPRRGSSSLLDEIECALRSPPGSP